MNSSPRLAWGRSLTGVIAAIVLGVGGFALIRGCAGDNSPVTPPTPASTTVSAPAATGPATTEPVPTSTTRPEPKVSVPNVVGLRADAAVTAIQTAGLDTHIEKLPIASAPAGFVLSQSPLPATEAPEGTTVALIVSAKP